MAQAETTDVLVLVLRVPPVNNPARLSPLCPAAPLQVSCYFLLGRGGCYRF